MTKSSSPDFQLDFIGIGASKSGTTWLAVCLGEHPQICISRQKDIQYFCSMNIRLNTTFVQTKGEDWLQAQFSHWTPGQLRGEISASYLPDLQSPKLIKARFPEARIIVSFRNPIDRLYSIYYHYNREYAMPTTFEDFLEEYPQLAPTGLYYTHLRRYLDHFSEEKIHFILFEEICCQPRQALVALFKFLGVDPSFTPLSWPKKFNEKKAPRLKLLKNMMGYARNRLNSQPWLFPFKEWLITLGIEKVVNSIYAANLQPARASPMNQETRLRLIELYAPENELLSKLLKKDLSHWNR
jgi:hypothetical protein